MEKRQPQSNRSFSETTPFRSPISPSLDTYRRHNHHHQHRVYQQQQQQQRPVQNRFLDTHVDETLESAFSRLNVGPRNNQPLYSSFEGPINDYGISGQSFLSDQTLNLQQNSDISNLGLLDYGFNNSVVGSDNGFMSGFNQNGFFHDSTPLLQQNRNGFLRPPSDNLYNNRKPLNLPCIKDFRGRIMALAKDQNGCRFLQRSMNGVSEEEIEMIFLEVIDCVGELMLDPFGNYVIQKLVEVCSEEQMTRILLRITKNEFQLVSICLNMHGTRAVQKLLENLTTQQQISLVMSALSPGAVALTKDMNGHHVIQHCLKHFSNEDNRYLLNEVADNSFLIATDKSGCCVLQQCVEYSQGESRERLVAEIIANALLLAEDRYGNYVVQHMLGLRVPQITANLLRQLEGSYTALSFNKYGSNVVEKCLLESGEQQSARIIMELLRNPNVSMLLMDPYGNYVIQSALSVSKNFVYKALLDLVDRNTPMMRSNIYGKKVLTWIERRKLVHI